MAFGRVSVRMNDSPSASTYCIQSSSELLKSLLVHLQSCLAHTKYSHQINRNNCCLLKTLTCHSEWATFISLLFSYQLSRITNCALSPLHWNTRGMLGNSIALCDCSFFMQYKQKSSSQKGLGRLALLYLAKRRKHSVSVDGLLFDSNT